mgnify:CR=1 FL=1
MGILIIECSKERKLIQKLMDKRCGNKENDSWHINKEPCSYYKLHNKKCSYHKNNNTEIHYKKFDSKKRFYIAEKWINFLLEEDRKLTKFYILGINLTNLNYKFFGDTYGNKRYNTIYNRFFRSSIQKSVKSYFSNYDEIIINEIIHDDASIKNNKYFPWHSIKYLEKEDKKISFNNKNIIFKDSDHRISHDIRSNLLQFIDLILGLTFNCLHYSSSQSEKEKLSIEMYDLVEGLLYRPSNINSHYKYINRFSIDFFPKHKLKNPNTLEGQKKRKDSYFKKREIRIKRIFQPTLFEI